MGLLFRILVIDNTLYSLVFFLLLVWQGQSSLIEAQQGDQPVLQIMLQEVISMIDSTAHEETIGDDVRHEEMIGDDVRHEETIGDNVRHEEMIGDDMQQ